MDPPPFTPLKRNRMGRQTLLKTRASVMYPKGTSDYWMLKDQQEQAFLEADESSSSDFDHPKDSEEPVRKTPRVSSRASMQREMQELQLELLSTKQAQAEEAAQSERKVDEKIRQLRSAEQKHARIEAELAEAKRRFCIELSEKERELKEQERKIVELEQRVSEEVNRRQLCDEEKSRVAEEMATCALRMQQAEAQAKEAKEMLQRKDEEYEKGSKEREKWETLLTTERLRVAELTKQLEESERVRFEVSKSAREATELREDLDMAKKEVEALRAEADASLQSKLLINTLQREKRSLEEQLAEERTKASAVEMLRDRAESLEVELAAVKEQLTIPKEDPSLRGSLEEAHQEISLVREEKRNLQRELQEVNRTNRRLARTNEALQKQLSDAPSKDIVQQLEAKVAELSAQLSVAPTVYGSLELDKKVAAAQSEVQRAQRASTDASHKAHELRQALHQAEQEKQELTLSLESAEVEKKAKDLELQELESNNRSLRDELEQYRREERERTEAKVQLEEDEERARSNETRAMRKSVSDVTIRTKTELKEAIRVLGDITGWRFSKASARGAVEWKVAPIPSSGKVQWKKHELLVRVSKEGDVSVAPSPMLTLYQSLSGARTGASAAEVLHRCYPHFYEEGKSPS